jgi:hypothetical protein
MNEEKRKETLETVVSENLPPIETINFMLSKKSLQTVKEMAEVSIDNALFTLSKKPGFHFSNYEEFLNFYEKHFQNTPPELKNHVQEYLERKIMSGEMDSLLKKIEFEQKTTPESITIKILGEVFNDDIKRKIKIAVQTGGDERLYEEIKNKIIQKLKENAAQLALHGGAGYSIKLDLINSQIQNIGGAPGWVASKLKLDDKQNEILTVNNLIKNLALKQQQEQPAVKEKKEEFTLQNLTPNTLQEIESSTQQTPNLEKPEKPEPSIEPSINAFLENFFEKQNKNGKLVYTTVKKNLTSTNGEKIKGKELYEKAREFIEKYAQHHQIKKYESNPGLLKNDEKTRNFFITEHKKLVELIKKLKNKNPQNTSNPEDLEAYFNIYSALNILQSRLSEFTTPYMKSRLSVT